MFSIRCARTHLRGSESCESLYVPLNVTRTETLEHELSVALKLIFFGAFFQPLSVKMFCFDAKKQKMKPNQKSEPSRAHNTMAPTNLFRAPQQNAHLLRWADTFLTFNSYQQWNLLDVICYGVSDFTGIGSNCDVKQQMDTGTYPNLKKTKKRRSKFL